MMPQPRSHWLSKSKDPPTIPHIGECMGMHGQIFGFDEFLANSENLCYSYDEATGTSLS